jgi:GDP-mannose pyrophosphatase NudK
LYNTEKNTVLLVRQFRIATYVNGNASGELIETCAGLLDDDSPEDCIRKEAIEETGYQVGKVEKLYEAYMSPGGVTELIHFFAAEYSDAQRTHAGGGVDDEEITVLELSFPEALAMVKDGRIRDGKAIMLLQHAQITGWLKA